ncbi:hypothetical protein MUK42_35475 [Musa troglodytarum]|uniref:Uncharacterized protein n=1 Tax=Musa troglodytarum TaxID=320322 RepID=A0A9E7K879_9LILI|nr:hypothetical protein MUK42_35475 [Musa troglodytarum]
MIGLRLSIPSSARDPPHRVRGECLQRRDQAPLIAGPARQSSSSSSGHPWVGRINFHRLNIKYNSRLGVLIRISDVTIMRSARRHITTLVRLMPSQQFHRRVQI